MAKTANKLNQKWKMRDGKVIHISEMSDPHLANAIKALVRNWIDKGNKSKVSNNPHYKNLTNEARKRKFSITVLEKPTKVKGKEEYVEIIVPSSMSKISSNFITTDWDSRPDET